MIVKKTYVAYIKIELLQQNFDGYTALLYIHTHIIFSVMMCYLLIHESFHELYATVLL